MSEDALDVVGLGDDALEVEASLAVGAERDVACEDAPKQPGPRMSGWRRRVVFVIEGKAGLLGRCPTRNDFGAGGGMRPEDPVVADQVSPRSGDECAQELPKVALLLLATSSSESMRLRPTTSVA